MPLVSVLFALLTWGVAFWVSSRFGLNESSAALLAVAPALATHLRWQKKGKSSLTWPLLIFLLCLASLLAAQTYAFQYSSAPFDAWVFLLYPCLAMCVGMTVLGALTLLRRGQAA